MNKLKFTLVVITLNEEKNLENCLKSVPSAHEIIIVDSGSTDKTCEIAQKFKAQFIYHPWEGYGRQKQWAINQAKTDWILLLDADEFFTKENHDFFLQELKKLEDFDALEIPIKQIFMNKICHHGKSVSFPIRFFNKKSGSYDLKNIHESFVVNGKIFRAQSFLLHNSATTIKERIVKIYRDTDLELKNNQSKIFLKDIYINPIRYFLSYLFKKKAILDGIPGIILTFLFSYQIYYQNKALYERNKIQS